MTEVRASHHVVVLGGGYTGVMAALRAVRRTRKHGGQVILVNPSPTFTERLRMHQIATDQPLEQHTIADFFAGTDIELVLGWADGIDPANRTVHVAVHNGDRHLHYDSLVYAIGSATPLDAVPGSDIHAHTLNGPTAAGRLATRLTQLADGDRVAVVGNGLTGIEAATEIAESHPTLRVLLLGRDDLAPKMGPRAKAHLVGALDRLRIEHRSGVEVTKVLPGGVEVLDGPMIDADAVLWTTGFTASPLAADAGLTVDAARRVIVDAELRSVSHPEIFAIGDAAAITQPWGVIHGTCQSGMPSAAAAADNIGRLIRGKRPRPFRFGYIHQPISLGRNDAVVQFTKIDDSPGRFCLTGAAAVRYKEAVTSSVPTTYGLSRRMAVPLAMLSRRGPRR